MRAAMVDKEERRVKSDRERIMRKLSEVQAMEERAKYERERIEEAKRALLMR